MKYENAQNILPSEIIEVIQGYIDGGYLYIPKKDENKKRWGENSNIKEKLKQRNREIYNRYLTGTSVKELTNTYYLTDSSIRRILREYRMNDR